MPHSRARSNHNRMVITFFYYPDWVFPNYTVAAIIKDRLEISWQKFILKSRKVDKLYNFKMYLILYPDDLRILTVFKVPLLIQEDVWWPSYFNDVYWYWFVWLWNAVQITATQLNIGTFYVIVKA